MNASNANTSWANRGWANTGWEGQADAELLCALAQQDAAALRELHRRYAPSLYALARREHHPDPERRVQDAWLFIMKHAHGHARSSLAARPWIIALAQRALTTAEGPT